MKTWTAAISFSLLFILTSGCAIVHRYGPYYGKVTDTETKEPLEGAAVLVVCNTQSYGPGGSNDNYVDAQETMTDRNGEFKIPAFTIWTFRPLQNFASYVDFTIFKPGYGGYPDCKGVMPIFMPPGNLPNKEHVTIELPKLKAGVMCSSPSVNFDIPYKKQKNFIEILNLWKEQIGSDKYTEKSFERR